MTRPRAKPERQRMNNLLKFLSEVAPPSSCDLKLLLTAVSASRHVDTKILDQFYDSLEGVLMDIRMVTMDNHDAEAFLKPVSKIEVPDYHEVITTPMDFQTMMRKVKQKQYKSKLEFNDDLELVWSNCFTYNANQDHPLRACAARLKLKSQIMLKNITDLKERQDPFLCLNTSPTNVPTSIANGSATAPFVPQRDISHKSDFSETPAIVRTSANMVRLRRSPLERSSSSSSSLAPDIDLESLIDQVFTEQDYLSIGDTSQFITSDIRESQKRKSGILSSPTRPRKRARSNFFLTMNKNIRTMRHARRVHAKLAALTQNTTQDSMDDMSAALDGSEINDYSDSYVDERPWEVPKGIEIERKSARDCLLWMSRKILEHAGFQGASKAALDVLSGVASEYLLNVGKTIHFLCDKYAHKMSPEEIILHTLFESGITNTRDLSRYFKNDVIRHGSRLVELDKKLASAYKDATTVEVVDDEELFRDADGDDGNFILGAFSDAIGDDFLGLRELGIASELGLSSLTVPTKLLRGKNKPWNNSPSDTVSAAMPPPPYPPPPPLIPLNSLELDHQIGLLIPYYQGRFTALASPDMGLLPAPQQTAANGPDPDEMAAAIPDTVPPLILLDDPPLPSQIRMGPLGNINKSGSTANVTRKRTKGKGPGDPKKGT